MSTPSVTGYAGLVTDRTDMGNEPSGLGTRNSCNPKGTFRARTVARRHLINAGQGLRRRDYLRFAGRIRPTSPVS